MSQYIQEMVQYITKDMTLVLQYLPAGLVSCLFVGGILAGAARLGENPLKSWKCYGAWGLLAGYLAVMLFITFLSREPGSREGIDLVLFQTVGHGAKGDAFVLENILLFIPFGILMPAAGKFWRKAVLTTAAGLTVSCGIEAAQFMTQRGFAQLDDIVTNTFGTWLGYMAYRLFAGKKIVKLQEDER